MDYAASEWSNGCESGWTVYLEESYISRNNNVCDYPQSYTINSTRNDEEDLSMVSDASSGPPHFLQEDDEQSYSPSSRCISKCYLINSEKSSKKGDKRPKKSSKEHKKVSSTKHQHIQYHLDDTASSPAITQSKIYDNHSTMDFSYMSTTHYPGNSSFSNHYGAFWQSSHIQGDIDHSTQPGQLSGRWE